MSIRRTSIEQAMEHPAIPKVDQMHRAFDNMKRIAETVDRAPTFEVVDSPLATLLNFGNAIKSIQGYDRSRGTYALVHIEEDRTDTDG